MKANRVLDFMHRRVLLVICKLDYFLIALFQQIFQITSGCVIGHGPVVTSD